MIEFHFREGRNQVFEVIREGVPKLFRMEPGPKEGGDLEEQWAKNKQASKQTNKIKKNKNKHKKHVLETV